MTPCLLAALVCACGPATQATAPASRPGTGAPVRVRSFSDSMPITSLAAAGGLIWAGTPYGLIRWTQGGSDKANSRPIPAVLTTADGLPADRIVAVAIDGAGGVWVVTPKGVSRYDMGVWTNFPPPPVGDLVIGVVPLGRGEVAWVGGSDGIARLQEGTWQHFSPGTAVTAMAADAAGGVWIGTSGKGVLRIVGDSILQFGPLEGNDIDNVRGIAAGEGGAAIVVGDSPGGPRLAYYDGSRFYSYRVDTPVVLEWVRRAGPDLLLGGGQFMWSLKRIGPSAQPSGPVRLTFVGQPVVSAPRAQPLKSLLPTKAPPRQGPEELLQEPAPPPPPNPKNPKTKAKGKQVQLPPPAQGETWAEAHPVRPWLVAGPAGQGMVAPRFDTEPVKLRLPDGVTSVTSDSDALYVGTRFLGVTRLQGGQAVSFRLHDLTAGAERLSVACVSNDECYVATGGTKAWRFDGQSFEVTMVDPEKGSHVLAVVRDPSGAVLALHRGPTSKAVRISRVGPQGRWTPIGMTSLEVPMGVPDISFAAFSPRGRLWVGLRYTDRDQDLRDFGAAEVSVDDGKVIYHRQKPKGAASNVTEGAPLPTDVVAVTFRGPDEIWFASKSGAVRLLDGKVKVFTENDGLESELIHDVVEGLAGTIWVATSRGIGIYDGVRWTFPQTGHLNRRCSALARDPEGRIWVGSDHGVMEVIDENRRHFIGTRTGLLDDRVLNLSVDLRGRIWVLTEKGISIIEPL
ncbi:MAG: hypothetical protein RMK29_20495 [Myxococcales bacterium]|nr:hypothetical protein [Myxococcota bacterium]MDW8284091.1 hypothetical protein [Myxococcales bacterium]